MNQEVEKKKLLITTDTYYPKRDGVLVFLERIIPALAEEYDLTIAIPVFDKDKIKEIKNVQIVGFEVSKKLAVAGYESVKISKVNRKKLKELVKQNFNIRNSFQFIHFFFRPRSNN